MAILNSYINNGKLENNLGIGTSANFSVQTSPIRHNKTMTLIDIQATASCETDMIKKKTRLEFSDSC